jgi:hypothetical protein
MKAIIRVVAISSLLAACLPLQGCAVAAIGAGIAAVSYATSQKQKAYADYRTETEKLNLDREKARLTPRPILTFKEWSKGQQ